MKTIILYGELAKRFGSQHKFRVKNVHEALRALKANFKGFGELMSGSHVYGIGYRVMVGSHSLSDEAQVLNPSSDNEVIRIVPALFGSGGVFRVLLGVALIVGGVLVSALTFGGAAALGQGMIVAGIGLVIGGVSQLLSKPPSTDAAQEAEKKQSYIFNGPQNNSVQGGPVPVGYGRMVIGSVTISAGIETYES